METFRLAQPDKNSGRQVQPPTSHDIITSPILGKLSFMGNFSDKEIEASIRRTREAHKEIVFKPRNFGF